MKKTVIIISILLCISVIVLLCSCAKTDNKTLSAKDFRVTSYIICDENFNEENFDPSNLYAVTDLIVFGNAVFDENGDITLLDNFESSAEIIRKYSENKNVYLNILGPGSQSSSDDWNEQMYDLADRHTSAFKSGKMEKQIKDILEKYKFNGIVFDYEFPLRSKDWKAYDAFILSLRDVLEDDFKIGMSMVSWNLKQSKAAREATDFFEIMSYDLWDDNGYHATMEIAEDDIKKMIKKGYAASSLDLGIPFYARPTTKEAYWYDYSTYYDKLTDDGLYKDEQTGLTFSFNTYEMVKEKTEYALANGIGGMMIWHYRCDVPSDNEKSLFKAIVQAKNEAIEREN